MTNDTIQDMHRSLFSSSPPWAGAFGSMPNSRMSFTLSTFDNIDVVVMNLGRVRCCVMLCRRLSAPRTLVSPLIQEALTHINAHATHAIMPCRWSAWACHSCAGR